jgi:uncharacterized protein (DUF736 family)
LISPFSAAGPPTAEAEGLATLVVGWPSGSVIRQAGRHCAIRGGAIECTDIVSRPALMAASRRETRPGSIRTPFRTSGFLFSRQATPPLAWPHVRHVFSLKAVWHATDAVSSMPRSPRWTAAPRSSFRNGGGGTFFPWASPIPRGRQESRSAAILRCAPALTGAASVACGLLIAIETAVVAGSDSQGETKMATIGTFERVGDSEYLGDIFTLSLRAKNVRIVSVGRTNENAPSHRIYIDQVDVGAGWSKRSPEGRDYLSIKLDDPSFNAPIYANLVHAEGAETCSLIWSRPNRRQGD